MSNKTNIITVVAIVIATNALTAFLTIVIKNNLNKTPTTPPNCNCNCDLANFICENKLDDNTTHCHPYDNDYDDDHNRTTTNHTALYHHRQYYGGESATVIGQALSPGPGDPLVLYTAGSTVRVQYALHWDVIPFWYWLLWRPYFYAITTRGGVYVGYEGDYDIRATVSDMRLINKALNTSVYGVALYRMQGDIVAERMDLHTVGDQLNVTSGVVTLGGNRHIYAGEAIEVQVITGQRAKDYWNKEYIDQYNQLYVDDDGSTAVVFDPTLMSDSPWIRDIVPYTITIEITRLYPLINL